MCEMLKDLVTKPVMFQLRSTGLTETKEVLVNNRPTETRMDRVQIETIMGNYIRNVIGTIMRSLVLLIVISGF